MSERGTGDPNTQMTALIGLLSALLLFVVVVFLQAFFYHSEAEENQRKVVAVTPEELAQVRAEQEEALHSYRWIDEKKQVVAIPIERAMDLVVQQLGSPAAAPAPASKTPHPSATR